MTDDWNRVTSDTTNTYTWTDFGTLRTSAPKAAGGAVSCNAWRGAGTITYDTRQYAPNHFLHNLLLHQSSTQSIGTSLVYDADLNLTRLEWNDGVRNTIDRYHDGDDMVLELRRVYGPGASQWARYVHGPNSDQPLAMELYPAGAQPHFL